MLVGFIVNNAARQPNDRVHAEIVAELGFDLGATQVWVTVRIQQATFGRDQGAFAVNVDRTALPATEPPEMGPEPDAELTETIFHADLATALTAEADRLVEAGIAFRLRPATLN